MRVGGGVGAASRIAGQQVCAVGRPNRARLLDRWGRPLREARTATVPGSRGCPESAQGCFGVLRAVPAFVVLLDVVGKRALGRE
jgi:hypothetical protein